MIIIALTGPKTVGKTTFAKLLCRNSNVPTVVVSFADPIKGIARKLGFVLPEGGNKEAPVKRGFSCRDAWIAIGEGLREKFYPEVWIDQMGAAIEAHDKIGGWAVLIIDDLRQPDEAQWLKKEHNAFIVELDRGGVDYTGGVLERPLPAYLVDTWIRLYNIDEADSSKWHTALADQVLRHAKTHSLNLFNPQPKAKHV